MPLEKSQNGKERRYAEELRHKIDSGETGDKVPVTDPAAAPLGTDAEAGGYTATTQEVEMAIKEETKPVSEQLDKSYYAEASLTKKITVFALTTVLILITLGLIYAYLPLGTPR